MSTLEHDHQRLQGPAEEVVVSTVRLDDVLRDVARLDSIKCGVERHEDSVVEGATDLLREYTLTLVVELEYRHRGRLFDDVFERFTELGAHGYGVYKDGLCPAALFELEGDQLQWVECRDDVMPDGYVNDFVFATRDVNLRALPA